MTAPQPPAKALIMFMAPESVPAKRSPISAQDAQAGPMVRSLNENAAVKSTASSQTLSAQIDGQEGRAGQAQSDQPDVSAPPLAVAVAADGPVRRGAAQDAGERAAG